MHLVLLIFHSFFMKHTRDPLIQKLTIAQPLLYWVQISNLPFVYIYILKYDSFFFYFPAASALFIIEIRLEKQINEIMDFKSCQELQLFSCNICRGVHQHFLWQLTSTMEKRFCFGLLCRTNSVLLYYVILKEN